VGAVLETVGVDIDEAVLDDWRARVQRMRVALGWPDGALVARVHASGASLALAAPLDQLFTATEVNEWALLSALFSFSLREKVPAGRMREEHGRKSAAPNSGRLSAAPLQPAHQLATPSVAHARALFPSPQPLSRGERGFKLPTDPERLAFVRQLRHTSTDSEQLCWYLLRNRRVFPYKFRRQHALGPYVLDFYCHELKLAIELDGGQHNEVDEETRDERRSRFLAEQGIQTLRFWNSDVLQRTEDVVAELSVAIEQRSAAIDDPGPAAIPQFHAPGHPAAWDEDAAQHTLRAFARAERQPALIALVDAAQSRGLTVLIDDDTLSFGVGDGSRSWPLASLPVLDAIDWNGLREAPIALVTGSNGKTTTTRLLAALTREHGWRTAYTCTDGVFVGATALAAGDYSGPAGARVALREPAVDAAILETARGGILRRGIAVQHANVAIVTNVSDDHFGEYGVHDLDDLAAVKLAVARTLGQHGVLVVNADDASLVRHALELKNTIAWFASDADAPLLRAHRERGGSTCGVRDGRLLLHVQAGEHDLGAVAAMPLSFGGSARYNIANIAAAVLSAHALGVAMDTLRQVLANFGAARADNPGRLQRWSIGGIDVLVDYAHNPDGLRGLLEVAARLRRRRLGLVLGQAGNREDAEIRELAVAAAQFAPDRIVLKDIAGMLRGRAAGAVPAILHVELIRRGVDAERIAVQLDEFDAVRDALSWARVGDTLVLPVHGTAVKARVAALLELLLEQHWQAGAPLPQEPLNPPAPAG